jgi:dTDP-4-amino-4,6-dideoxygalactose transaminase
MTDIPLVDLKVQYATIGRDVQQRIARVIQEGRFVLGSEVAEFESEFAAYCQCRHAVGVASGLDALKLSLRGLQIGPGDEVITAANTFIATALAISAVGAKPVLVDVDPDRYNLDPARLADAITSRTKAVVPVHLYGQPADMDEICYLADEHRLNVVEDASQAHGARYRGRRTGSLGDVAAFSLYPGKNLGCYGQGGVVTTRDEQLAETIAVLRNYGSKQKYRHELRGENSRLDTIQAAVLSVKLQHLDRWNGERRRAAGAYRSLLEGVGDLVLPAVAPDVEHVYHQFVIRTARRDRLLARLNESGIGAMIHYPIPIHLQPAYADHGWQAGDFPVAERLAAEMISLPMYPELQDQQIERVCSCIKEFFRGARRAA